VCTINIHYSKYGTVKHNKTAGFLGTLKLSVTNAYSTPSQIFFVYFRSMGMGEREEKAENWEELGRGVEARKNKINNTCQTFSFISIPELMAMVRVMQYATAWRPHSHSNHWHALHLRIQSYQLAFSSWLPRTYKQTIFTSIPCSLHFLLTSYWYHQRPWHCFQIANCICLPSSGYTQKKRHIFY